MDFLREATKKLLYFPLFFSSLWQELFFSFGIRCLHCVVATLPNKLCPKLNHIVTVCVFVCHMFSYHQFYFDFHSARVIFDMSSGFYFWNVNKTPTCHLSKMFKVAFYDVSTKNSEPTYWIILFVMLKIYFILSIWKKIQKGYIKLNYVVCLSDIGSSCHVTVMGSLIVLVNKRADWDVPVSYIKY